MNYQRTHYKKIYKRIKEKRKVDMSILIDDSGMSWQEFLTIDPNLMLK